MKPLLLCLAVLVPFAVFSQNDRPAATPAKPAPEGAVTQYKIIQSPEPSALETAVNAVIRQGWQPLGTVVVTPANPITGTSPTYVQAMTLTPKR